MIACSACGAPLKVGSATCPNCHLPVTAQAVYVRRGLSTFSLVLLTLLAIAAGAMLIGNLVGH